MSEERTVWIVGESDDHIEAVFTTKEAAEACLAAKQAPIRALEEPKFGSAWEQFSHWWMDEYPLDPPPASADIRP